MAYVKRTIDTPEANMPTMSNTNMNISSCEQGGQQVFQISPDYALRAAGLLCKNDGGNGVAEGSQSGFYCTQAITHQLKTMTSGGIYWEVLCESNNLGDYAGGQVGLIGHGSENAGGATHKLSSNRIGFCVEMAPSGTAKSKMYMDNVEINQHLTGDDSAGARFLQGHVMNWAVRYDGKVFVGINGTWLSNGIGTGQPAGNPVTGTGQLCTLKIDPDNVGETVWHYVPACGWCQSNQFHWNFGGDGSFDGQKTSGNNTDANGEGDFFNAVPTGYVRLCAKNIGDSVQSGYNTYNVTPTVTNNDASDHFGMLPRLNGTGAASITINHNMDFTPDMVWAKGHSFAGAGNDGAFHMYNRINLTENGGNSNELRIDRSYGESNNVLNYGDITEITSTTLKIEGSAISGNNNNFNRNGYPSSFWMWNMGGKPTATNNNSYETINAANGGFGQPSQGVTVAGGVFVLTPGTGTSGTQNNPALTMTRSSNTIDATRTRVYEFSLDDASNNGHPLVIKDASDNIYSTGVVYEIGGSAVTQAQWTNTATFNAGVGNRLLKLTLDVNAPNTGLKYSCFVHGNSMGNTITTVEGNTMDDNSVIRDGVLQTNFIPAGTPYHYPKKMSVNTKAGMSCLMYTGTNDVGSTVTLPHGLGTRPQMIWVKQISDTSSATDWAMYHHKIRTGNGWETLSTGSPSATVGNQPQNNEVPKVSLSLSASDNGNDEISTTADPWADTHPKRHVVTISPENNQSLTNRNGQEYMMWCFVEVPGFSMFGRYEGNAHSSGLLNPFVYCGFKPQFIMTKKYNNVSNNVSEWSLFDYSYESNPKRFGMAWRDESTTLWKNNWFSGGYQGAGGNTLDIYSNGFKIQSWQSGSAALNNSPVNDVQNSDFVFIAFAKSPFKYSNAVGSMDTWPNI